MIENIPDDILERLRNQARRHRRSIQGEVLAILGEALPHQRPTVGEVRRRLSEPRLETPSESTTVVRADRDSR